MSTVVFILPFLLLYLILVVYAERKISAFMQDRLGPMEVGYYGLLQTVADLIKLLQKEDIVPRQAQVLLFKAAPVFIFIAVFGGFSVIPLSPSWPAASVSSGVFLLLAIVSLDIIGIVVAGWSSGNKYSSLGSFRAVAQIVSYEIPLTLSVLCVVIFSGSLDLQEISLQQGVLSQESQYLFGVRSWQINSTGGFLAWNVFQMPFLFIAWIVFFISSLAESNRAPFDLPEAESELVAGFQTEYSGFRWSILALSEYAMMLLVSLLGAILFFGSWNSILPNVGGWDLASATTGAVWGIFWIVIKTVSLTILQIWVRWTYPRVRIDQLINLSWKYLVPLSLILVIISGFWKLWLA